VVGPSATTRGEPRFPSLVKEGLGVVGPSATAHGEPRFPSLVKEGPGVVGSSATTPYPLLNEEGNCYQATERGPPPSSDSRMRKVASVVAQRLSKGMGAGAWPATAATKLPTSCACPLSC
jgi:hypothetical protein